MISEDQILYIDNHLIAINKKPGEISQSDVTGDVSLLEDVKLFIKEKYNKPGNVYVGLVHRIDRPVSGVLLFARTSKAAERLSQMIRDRAFKKTYWAVVKQMPKEPEGRLENYLLKNAQMNKSFVAKNEKGGAKKAVLHYRLIYSLERYHLLEVILETGRHHQIRAQLSAIGCPIKGDLKYGFDRSNPDGSIHLHARSISFEHPVTHAAITIIAPPPQDVIWNACLKVAEQQ
ncbi:MAG TPA: RNA pseudouridine synthase [Chitinophagales bacterium]|nr:RNA pseudouridine synthase [Chitinophagales bacterium]HMU70297.1 RNA pseudouridine synthase [Chitinophagales bacterium]HMX03651.1 RNA pseudouridine synthase [Chitinophagales bacterium]HMZ87944.1 RNA pseudouridine synthase [Chitinophagales bacterium]HNA56740.1 RNA pseudouridine synthase [Chitinophagales bacterium]